MATRTRAMDSTKDVSKDKDKSKNNGNKGKVGGADGQPQRDGQGSGNNMRPAGNGGSAHRRDRRSISPRGSNHSRGQGSKDRLDYKHEARNSRQRRDQQSHRRGGAIMVMARMIVTQASVIIDHETDVVINAIIAKVVTESWEGAFALP